MFSLSGHDQGHGSWEASSTVAPRILYVAAEMCRGAPPGSARRKLAFRLATLPPARRLKADSRRHRSGAIGPAMVIRAPACTWTEVAAKHSLQASFGFAMMRRAPQVGAPRHISTAAEWSADTPDRTQRRAVAGVS